VGADLLACRSDWVKDGKPIEMTLDPGLDPCLLEAQYVRDQVSGDALGIVLDGVSLAEDASEDSLWPDKASVLQTADLLEHPTERLQKWIDEVASAPAQAMAKKKDAKAKSRVNLKVQMKKWKAALGCKDPKKVLARKVPAVGGKVTGAKKKPSLSRKQLKKQAAFFKMKKQKAADETKGPLVGCRAVVVGEDVAVHWQGRTVVVCGERPDQLLAGWGEHEKLWLNKSSVRILTGKVEDEPQLPQPLKLPNPKVGMTILEKLADKGCRKLTEGSMLTDADMDAGLHELRLRYPLESLEQGVLMPTPAEVASYTIDASWWKNLEQEAAVATLALLVVHGSSHWALLVGLRASVAQPWVFQFWDSLPGLCAAEAQKTLDAFTKAVGQQAQLLPPVSGHLRQQDGWSCGLWVLQRCEQAVRAWLKKPQQPTERSALTMLSRLNVFLGWLDGLQAKAQAKAKAKAKAAAKAAASKPAPNKATTVSKASASKAAAPVSKAAPDKAEPPEQQFGCSKCKGSFLNPRVSKNGCMNCNPAKAMKWGLKKEAEGHPADSV
jgi:hypothetical protein